MNDVASIQADRVGVRFLVNRQRRLVTPGLARLRRGGTESWGLREVSFDIGPGESVALLGASGSGKTSLLRLLAGVYDPDEGGLVVDGDVGSLLSVDAGLMPVLTGRENLELLAALAGVPLDTGGGAAEIARRTELVDAFDRPTASYSQGMRARLGFAVQEQADPSIFVLDEVHEALDHRFRAIVHDHVRAIVDEGGIVVAAGHDHPLLADLCDRALWLADGHVAADGPFEAVRQAYLDATA